MLENKTTTPLSELGEFALIDLIKQHVEIQNPSTIKGIGDDAAVMHYANKQIVVTTDILHEGIHFDLGYVPLKHLGYKAVSVNVSDVYAMNAEPKQITVSIAVSSKFTVEAIEDLYAGILAACKHYKVDLVGGDTTSSNSGLFISITAIGEADKEKIVYRSTANDNDLVCVTGDLGGAYIGLQLLERENNIFKENPNIQPDLEGNDYVLERQLKPEARKDIFELFQQLELVPTSMIDISDGLASELLHICKASDKGCNLYEEKIPIDPMTYDRAREFGLDPTVCALSGGEDYELLFTIKMSDYDKVKNNPFFTVIGNIADKANGCNLVSKSGTVHPITAQGWKAF